MRLEPGLLTMRGGNGRREGAKILPNYEFSPVFSPQGPHAQFQRVAMALLLPPTEPIVLNTRALPPQQPVNTPTGPDNPAADHTATPVPPRAGQSRSVDSNLERLPVRRSSGSGQGRSATLPNAPANVPHPVLAAARQPGIATRLADMRQYLADLKHAYAHGDEMEHPRDTQFLDLLVAMENARHPNLALGSHTIDDAALEANNPEAVASLASRLEASMRDGASWHAIVCVGGREVALSARHDPKQPRHISLVVVDSEPRRPSSPDWHHIAALVTVRLNQALARTGDDSTVRIRVNSLHTAAQTITDGSVIFALSAVKAMPRDADIRRLHKSALKSAAENEAPFGTQTIDDNRLLGARFFKHMTHPPRMEKLLKARPDLATQPVGKRSEQTLAEYQKARLRVHMPASFGIRHAYSSSYEDERLKLYERAIAHLDASVRLDGMADYLHALRHARTSGTAPPPPRDAEFMDLLTAAANMQDPQLRLSAHRIDTAKLADHDIDAIGSLKPVLTEGVKSGADWHATLDLDGHHVAVAARHDAGHPTHLSLAVADGAGSTLSRQDWANLARTIGKQLDANLRAAGDERTGKVWLTRLDISEQQTVPTTALFALLVAQGMPRVADIADAHREALAQASSRPENVAAGHFTRPDLLAIDDDDVTAEAGVPALDAYLKEEQIALYERAIPHIERALGLPPQTH